MIVNIFVRAIRLNAITASKERTARTRLRSRQSCDAQSRFRLLHCVASYYVDDLIRIDELHQGAVRKSLASRQVRHRARTFALRRRFSCDDRTSRTPNMASDALTSLLNST